MWYGGRLGSRRRTSLPQLGSQLGKPLPEKCRFGFGPGRPFPRLGKLLARLVEVAKLVQYLGPRIEWNQHGALGTVGLGRQCHQVFPVDRLGPLFQDLCSPLYLAPQLHGAPVDPLEGDHPKPPHRGLLEITGNTIPEGPFSKGGHRYSGHPAGLTQGEPVGVRARPPVWYDAAGCAVRLGAKSLGLPQESGVSLGHGPIIRVAQRPGGPGALPRMGRHRTSPAMTPPSHPTMPGEDDVRSLVKQIVEGVIGPEKSGAPQDDGQIPATEHKGEGGDKGGIAIGADHGGYPLKERIGFKLREAGWVVTDCGTHSQEAADYPDFAHAVAKRVAEGECRWGIIIDGAGIGSAMVANKVPGVRAAMCYDISSARNSREHNHSNILTLGAGLVGDELAWQIVDAWLSTEWSGGRHARRVAKIDAIEKQYSGSTKMDQDG